MHPSLPPHPLWNYYGSDSSAADYLSQGFFFQNSKQASQKTQFNPVACCIPSVVTK